ncbi:MAG TPA: FAD-dependent oxidoreductase, partial [Chitinophaga sp.]
GEFPEAATLTLEWVGMIPGKRESRRFEGDYMLTQQDIVQQRTHDDAVAFGGWSIDLHPADGVFSEKPACNQWHSKGIYQIPYRCLYSRNLRNLFLAGRIISTSHVAFGSSRVMATGAYAGQASALAAAMCLRENLEPRQLLEKQHMQRLQTALLKAGQFIPGLALHDREDLAQQATLRASSEYVLHALPADGSYISLTDASGQMLPLPAGPVPEITVYAQATADTWLEVELRTTSTVSHHTPDVTLQTLRLPLQKGVQPVTLVFDTVVPRSGYVFLCFGKNAAVSLQASSLRVTGILSVFNRTNPAVSNFGKQEPPEDIGMDAFEFWCPERRPGGKNLALQLARGIAAFGAENIRNGIDRPVMQPNAWLADPADPAPALTLHWEQPQAIREIVLVFDTDMDHPMESVLMGHPERAMPFCVKAFHLHDEAGHILYETRDNHQTRRHITLAVPAHTRQLTLRITEMHGKVPPGLFAVRCYA